MEKVYRLRRARQLKMNDKKYQKMVILMEGMMVEDINMEIEWIESKITEMMEVEDQTRDNAEEWLEDRRIGQVMPEVKVTDTMEEEYMQISGEVPVIGPGAHTPVLSTGGHTNISD